MCFSRIPRVLPEVFVCDLVDILTKELFGGIFEDVFQEALRASALISYQLSISRFSQSAFRTQVKDYVTMGFYESTFTSLLKVVHSQFMWLAIREALEKSRRDVARAFTGLAVFLIGCMKLVNMKQITCTLTRTPLYSNNQ